MVHHNKWFVTEIDNRIYRARFIDYGWTYSDMVIQERKKIRIIKDLIEFWIWNPLIGSVKSRLTDTIIPREPYYEEKFALDLMKRAIHSINAPKPKSKIPPHSKIIGDGSRVDKINKIIGL